MSPGPWRMALGVWLLSCSALLAGDGYVQLSGQDFESANPYLITNSGVYVFTANVTMLYETNGIEVNADHVVIDLNGFTFRGHMFTVDQSAVRQSPGRRGLVVKNGFIERWGSDASSALKFEGAQARVENVILKENRGAAIRAGSQAVVHNCVFYNNGGGVYLEDHGVMSECVMVSNKLAGIEGNNCASVYRCVVNGQTNGPAILVHSNGVVRQNFCIYNQSGVAIAEEPSAAGNLLEDNHVVYNGRGIKATGTGANLILGNTALGSSTADYDLAPTNCYGQIYASPGYITNNNPNLNFSIK
jgi:parallel beta-helix repeat protein